MKLPYLNFSKQQYNLISFWYKQIPNTITSFRLGAASLLLALTFFTDLAADFFLALFIVAAVSDMLDGFIARRLNLCTDFGAKLDSISDLCLYLAVFTFLLNFRFMDIESCSILFAIGFFSQFLHLLYSYCRHGQFPAYHSTLSRISAYLIFFATLAYWQFNLSSALSIIALLWIACSIEGITISQILKSPVDNVSSIRKAFEITNKITDRQSVN